MIKDTNSPAATTDAVPIETPLLDQKTELAIRAIDLLMFGGQKGQMIGALAATAGVPAMSIALIFPTKNGDNMRRFLASVSLILSTAQDDLCDLASFTSTLATAVQDIEQIAKEDQ